APPAVGGRQKFESRGCFRLNERSRDDWIGVGTDRGPRMGASRLKLVEREEVCSMMEEARTGERRRPFSQVLRVAGHWWVPHSSGVRLPPLQHRARPGASCVL